MPTISSVGPIAVDPNSSLTGDGTVCHPLSISPEFTAKVVYNPFNPLDFSASDGGTWTVQANATFVNLYYIHGKRVTISLVIGGSIISPANTVRTIALRLPAEVSSIVARGPYTLNPTAPAGFVANSAVAIDAASPQTLNVIPTLAQVAFNTDYAPWPAMLISTASGKFPAPPLGGFNVYATCTYIIN